MRLGVVLERAGYGALGASIAFFSTSIAYGVDGVEWPARLLLIAGSGALFASAMLEERRKERKHG